MFHRWCSAFIDTFTGFYSFTNVLTMCRWGHGHSSWRPQRNQAGQRKLQTPKNPQPSEILYVHSQFPLRKSHINVIDGAAEEFVFVFFMSALSAQQMRNSCKKNLTFMPAYRWTPMHVLRSVSYSLLYTEQHDQGSKDTSGMILHTTHSEGVFAWPLRGKFAASMVPSKSAQ